MIEYNAPAQLNLFFNNPETSVVVPAPAKLVLQAESGQDLILQTAPALILQMAVYDLVVQALNVQTTIVASTGGEKGDAGEPGDAKSKQITQNNFNELLALGELEPNTIYFIGETKNLVMATSGSTYKTYYGIHIGPTAPSDTSLIWLQTLV